MMLQVSSVKVVEEFRAVDGWKFLDDCEIAADKCEVMILGAARHKCPRCWTYAAEVDGEVCKRCANVLSEQRNIEANLQ